jgi:hypothetical protein
MFLCNFNDSLTITYSKTEPNIINGKKVKYETLEFQKIIESHFKNRSADIIHINHNNTFNRVNNQYVQVLNAINTAIKNNQNEINFICDIKREILCSLCKKEWFVPTYFHINICDDCSECFFD